MSGITIVTFLCVHGFLVLTPIQARALTSNNDEITHDGRECKPLKDCYFYRQYEKKEIRGKLKTAIQNDISTQACGWDDHQEMKGSHKTNIRERKSGAIILLRVHRKT